MAIGARARKPVRYPGLKYDSPNDFPFKERLKLAIIPPVVAFFFKRLLGLFLN